MRRTSLTASGALVTMVAFGMLMSAGACGGATPKAKTAKGLGSDAAAAPAVTTVSNTQGQTIGVSAGPAADSELTGDAKDAYTRGFSAWAAGNLAGAKAAFMDAASKAPTAGGPRYSLGCVLVRLGDTQGALDAYRASYTANPKYEIGMGAYALLQAQSGHGSDAEQFLTSKGAQDSVRLMSYLAEVKSIEGDSPAASCSPSRRSPSSPTSRTRWSSSPATSTVTTSGTWRSTPCRPSSKAPTTDHFRRATRATPTRC